jgi:demethylmenaquinone methyltransferase/2-methoxy-6-polyprenyl-1,4-benzoquinol methylase
MDDLRYRIDNASPGERKRFIRRMFGSIAPSYDAANRILTLGIDMSWRRSMVKSLGAIGGKTALDLCCGTGDVVRLLMREGARVVALDFCHAMIVRGREKGNIGAEAVMADASSLPFRDNTFDLLTMAFGIRNIPDIDNFIAEAGRVLKPNGILSILELTRPEHRAVAFLYGLYLGWVLPLAGWVISGRRQAYRYLAGTIATFIDVEALEGRISGHGFSRISRSGRSLGIATVITCRKAAEPGSPGPTESQPPASSAAAPAL